MHGCRCGYFGDPTHDCKCTPMLIHRYRARISGPILDRIDIHLEVPAVDLRELSGERVGLSSADMLKQVQAARDGG